MPLVKFSTLAGGVWIEVGPGEDHAPDSRCFRFDPEGRAEWTRLADLREADGRFARWFGHCFTARDFIFA